DVVVLAKGDGADDVHGQPGAEGLQARERLRTENGHRAGNVRRRDGARGSRGEPVHLELEDLRRVAAAEDGEVVIDETVRPREGVRARRAGAPRALATHVVADAHDVTAGHARQQCKENGQPQALHGLGLLPRTYALT